MPARTAPAPGRLAKPRRPPRFPQDALALLGASLSRVAAERATERHERSIALGVWRPLPGAAWSRVPDRTSTPSGWTNALGAEDDLVPSGSPPLAGKKVRIDFDGGRLTPDAGIVLLADIER